MYFVYYSFYSSLFLLLLRYFAMSAFPILTPVPSNYRRIMVFDVETTGLVPKPNPAKSVPPRYDECPYILQLSYAIYNLRSSRIEEVFNAYVSVPEEVPIVDRITEITGITREMIREKGQPIVPVLQKFYEAYMKCDCIIAHNIEFDQTMISIEIGRNTGLVPEMNALFTPEFHAQYKIDMYCTMLATVDLCGILVESQPRPGDGTGFAKPFKPRVYKKFPKLSELHHKLFGSIPENLHNSLIDVVVCLRCFLKIRCCIDTPDSVFTRMLRNAERMSSSWSPF